MSGWCNGSAGFVFLWTLAHKMLGKAEYGVLAEQAGLDAWESDGQIGNLCCGYGGQAYALLNLYKHTGDQRWLDDDADAARGTVHSGDACQRVLSGAHKSSRESI